MKSAKALDKVVVTELGQRGAVALCGSLLAQLGAKVIAIEPSGEARSPAARALPMAGKMSFSPDPASAEDLATLRRLVAASDIVLTSGDVDPDWLRPQDAAPPSNVVCDITAFGSTGPRAGEPLSELGVQALSGIMDTTGFPDGPPVPIRVPIVDVIAGTYAAGAALVAHRVRRRQGFGQHVEVALFDGAFGSLRSFLTSVLTSDKADKSRLGNRHPTVSPWNLFDTQDGYVLICAGNSYAMFERLCTLIGRPDIAPRYPTQKDRIIGIPEIEPPIADWTRRHTTAECVEQLLGVGVVAGPIVPVEDYPREENLAYRDMIQRALDPVSGRELYVPGSPLHMSATPGLNLTHIPAVDADRAAVGRLGADLPAGKTTPVPARPKRPLEGIRIIDFGQYTTAPMCARELAHLGAEVIKIEQAGGAESRSGAAVSFKMNNADKKTIAIDLKDPFDREVFRRLLPTADVLVENLKPGTLAKFGFPPAAIQAINPRMIYCPISGFGIDSLYPTRPAFDMVITAMAGFMSVLGADGFPLKSGISTADFMGAVMAIYAILGALEHRDRTGEGQVIDLSMQDVTAWLTQAAWNGAFRDRIEPAVIETADGYVLVEAGAAALAEALGGAGPVEALKGLPREKAVAEIAARGLAAVPVQSVREASRMAQTIARRLWFRMTENGTDWLMLSSPMRLAVTPSTVTHLALPVNHDREAILAELGMTEPV